jgi:hypothetical protein
MKGQVMNGTNKIIWIVSTVLTASIVGGCQTKFTVEHYPDFYKPSIKSVAVLPFENATNRKEAGKIVAAHLSGALAGNGTYKVTGPAQLEQTLKEKQMPPLKQNDYKQIAKELAGLDKYQAFIAGNVLSDSFNTTITEPYDDHYLYYDDYPYWYYPYWYTPYWYYPYDYEYGQVYVSVEVSMVDVPDGAILDMTVVKAAADISDMSSSLKKYASQMALDNLSKKIVANFAVVPVEIAVYPDKAIRTADSYEQESWHFTKTFHSDQESMYVVLCLPGAAAMNQFKLTITPQNNPSQIISSKDFTWERGRYCQGVEFSPRQIAQSNGPGRYSAHFISMGSIELTRNFKIK